MSTITREQLREHAREKVKSLEFAVTQTAFANTRAELEEELELARIALASLEAEPAIHRWRRVTVEPYGPYPWHYGNFIGFSKPVEGIEDEYFYSAPPAPAPAPAPAPMSVPEPIKRNDADGWWMYKGRRVGGGCAEWYNRALDDCRDAMLQGADGNSPVIPDGWVMVPVEPTYQMCEAMGLPWESPRFPDRYKSMIAAAPKLE